VLYDKNKTVLTVYPAGKTVYDFYSPDSVTSIGYYAFSGNEYIGRVWSIAKSFSIDEYAFLDCKNLKYLGMDDWGDLSSIGEGAFQNCGLEKIYIPPTVKSIGFYAFSQCYELREVSFSGTIPASGFNSHAFPDDGLRDVFYLTDQTNGSPGTYVKNQGSTTTPNGVSPWRKVL
jgi:hypothetical protein